MDRQLAAILAADVVGYSRLTKRDEKGTIAAVKNNLQNIIEPKVIQYKGRIVKLMGDGLLAVFPSVVDAVQCAVDIQHNIADRKEADVQASWLTYRIGVNIGDVVVEGDDIHGDGVNLAARLEALSKPGGICVSRSVFNQVKDKLDLTFESLGKKAIKNFPEPVTVFGINIDDKAEAIASPVIWQERSVRSPARRISVFVFIAVVLIAGVGLWFQPQFPSLLQSSLLPEKPTIAVLPFANIGNDAKQEFFSDGITNDLITDLSRFSSLFVIAANSTFTYKGKAVKIQEIARDLGVRYVVEGSVQKSSSKTRINAQLIDATTGLHIWADRYDRENDDLFELQNELVKNIVSNLAVKVDVSERERALRKETNNLGAYDFFLRAIAEFDKGTKESYAKSKKFLNQAIALDPEYAKAFGLLSKIHRASAAWSWDDDPESAMKLAYEFAQKAQRLAPDDYDSHLAMGSIHLYRKDYDKANASFQRVLELNPNDPDILVEMASPLIYLGRPEEAITQVETAMRYSPHFPEWYLGVLGWASYDAGRYEDAIAALNKYTNPPVWIHRQLAASYVQLGRLDDAQKEANKMLEREPDYRISKANKWPYKDQSRWDRYANDLRIAGIPD